MVLVGCIFVFIVGVGTLVGFIVHRRRERKLLESDSYNPSSSSMWLQVAYKWAITFYDIGNQNFWHVQMGTAPFNLSKEGAEFLKLLDRLF